MANPIRRKITKTTVDAARVDPSRRYIIWDTQVIGFGLLVLPSGVRSYIYQYRNKHGDTRRATIGKHGTWTADQARQKAERYHDGLKNDIDPLDARKSTREALTVGEILDLYLASARFLEKAESTREIDKGRIDRHLRPILGKARIDTLRPEDVRRAHNDIKNGKTAARIKTKARGVARVKGGAGTAREAVGLLRSILNWAVMEEMISNNPAALIKLGTPGQRETILESADDYRRLFMALDVMEAEKRVRRPVADAIRVIALTGARRGEIAGLKWGQVDLQRARLVIPPASHKTGRRTGKPRIISLPTEAQALIARQPEGGAEDFVFQPAKGDGSVDLSHPWRDIRAEAKLPEGIGLHGLRHSLASHMAMQGAQASEIMTALGHQQLSTAQRYVHWAEDARQALAQKAASVALAGLAASNGKDDAEVHEHPAAKGAT